MSACISFIKPMSGCSLYLIVAEDQIVGSIILKNSIITNIDINGDYLDTIKAGLMRSLMFELGINQIDLICNPVFFDYYSQLGFKLLNTDTDGVMLRYSV